MKHTRSVVALASLTLLLTSGVASANSGGTSTQRSAARQQAAGGGEFVVGFDMAQRDAALAAIAASGGVVVDELDQLGLALVETSNADFAASVRSATGVTGVVQNQSIGATEQGRAPVHAKERLTVVEHGSASARGNSAAKASKSKSVADPLESLQWDMAMINARAGAEDGDRQEGDRRHHRHGRRCQSSRHRTELQLDAEPQLHDGHPRHRRPVRRADVHRSRVGRRRRPWHPRCRNCRRRPERHRHHRRGTGRHDRQRPRRAGLGLLLLLRDRRRAALRGRCRSRRRQHELLHRPVAVQLRVRMPTTCPAR